MAELKELQL